MVTVDYSSEVALWNLAKGTIDHRFTVSIDQPNNTELIGEKTLPGVGLIEVGASH